MLRAIEKEMLTRRYMELWDILCTRTNCPDEVFEEMEEIGDILQIRSDLIPKYDQ